LVIINSNYVLFLLLIIIISKLYLYNVNRDLYLLFRRFGSILSVHIMINKYSGLSRGFGFISYTNSESADKAINEMNGFRVILCYYIHANV